MAEKYMFFNSTPDDRRRHQASDMAAYWSSFLSNGLIHKDGLPFLSLGLTPDKKGLYITPGTAIINGQLYINTDNLPMTLPSVSKETEFNIVLRWDNRIENRYIRMFVTEGAITRNDSVYELLLYKVKKTATTTEISAGDVTDYRLDEQLCGIASSLVTVPTNVFREEWDKLLGDYYKWLQSIQNESYATLGDLRSRDYELKRELSFLNLKLDAKDRIENGVTIGADFIREPLNMKFEDAKAEVDGDVIKGSKVIKYKSRSGDWSKVRGLTIYGGGLSIPVEVSSYTSSALTLKEPLSADIKSGYALIASAVKTDGGGIVIGEVSTGQTIELSSIDLGNTFEDWYLYGDHMYLQKGENFFYYDITNKKLTKIFTQRRNSSNAQKHRMMPLKNGVVIPDAATTSKYGYELVLFFRTVEWSRLSYPGDFLGKSYVSLPNKELQTFFVYDSEILKFRRVNSEGRELNLQTVEFSVLGTCKTSLGSLITLSDTEFLTHSITQNAIFKVNTSTNQATRVKDQSASRTRPFFSVNNSNTYLMHRYENQWEVGYFETNKEPTRIEGPTLSETKLYDDGYTNYLLLSGGGYIEWVDDTATFKTDDKINANDLITPYLVGKPKEKPFQLRDGRYAEGRFHEGVTLKPLTADVRIKIPQTKEVVLYAESTGGEIAGAWFGGIPATSKKSGNELQFVGYNENGSDQLRLRLSRKSTSDTIKVTRMLGGVLK